jgi:hypothetical protein
MLSSRYIYLPHNMNNLKLGGYSTHHRVSYYTLNLPAQYITISHGSYERAEECSRYWLVRGSNPDAGDTLRTRADRLWGPLILLHSGYRV